MAKKGIIYETLNEVKSLTIERNDGFMHLSGVFGVCGVRNNNQRVYETKNYAKMVESMQERLKKAPIPGELEHPQTMNITTENISHRIDSIKIDENGVVSGEITLLNTPKGKIAQAIVEGGLPLFISSRAQGQVDRNGNVTLEMLQTYDLVGSPGFSQAELHLNENQCYESICESMCFIGEKENIKEQKEETDMDAETLKNITEKLEELTDQVEYLSEQNRILSEELESKENFNLKEIADGIQKWIIEQYSPTLQQWITEEYSSKVQEWVVEEFAPKVQEWVVEHYSPEVQNWVVEEFAPEIQKWIVESYSPEVQNWLEKHYTPALTESLNKTFNEAKTNDLNMIDSILEMLENKKIEKPVYGRKSQMVSEGLNTPKYISEMPADIRVKYDLASQEIKESISRKAKLYDWSKPMAIQNFWESIDFDAKPAKQLNEDLASITDEREKALRLSIRAWRNK